jgi:hypothetical protein
VLSEQQSRYDDTSEISVRASYNQFEAMAEGYSWWRQGGIDVRFDTLSRAYKLHFAEPLKKSLLRLVAKGIA